MNEKPDFLTDEQWVIHQELRQKAADERKRLYENELKDNPPLPPWKKFPDAGMVDMVWSIGAGQEYLENYVFNYFSNASASEIEEYKKKYPEPDDWRGWYEDS